MQIIEWINLIYHVQPTWICIFCGGTTWILFVHVTKWAVNLEIPACFAYDSIRRVMFALQTLLSYFSYLVILYALQ